VVEVGATVALGVGGAVVVVVAVVLVTEWLDSAAGRRSAGRGAVEVLLVVTQALRGGAYVAEDWKGRTWMVGPTADGWTVQLIGTLDGRSRPVRRGVDRADATAKLQAMLKREASRP
jgi:hypothetical protein